MDNRHSTTTFSRRWLFLAIGLIVLSSALFVTGVVIEHAGAVRGAASSHQEATAGANTSHDADGGHDEGTSASSQGGSTAAAPETVFGLDLENPWTVGVYVLVWLGVLLALTRLGRVAWAALLVLAILSLVLDVGEIGRQFAEANTTVAAVAVAVSMAHAALVVLALFILARSQGGTRLAFV